ncbi:MAG: hypothetical protein HC842_05005, partial [Cytophagales bacterium]|nr:hypothetical protein [Cytophagales bacterium]
LAGAEMPQSSGLELEVRYRDKRGNLLNPTQVTQGTDLMTEVSLRNTGLQGDYRDLALSQVFPSGWEILNTRLDETQQYYKNDPMDYQDIRDDRVYTYFGLKAGEKKTFTLLLNAAYQGKFYQPAVSVQAMYDNSIRANNQGGWVEVK